MSLADDPIAALTPREREVLALIAAGKTNVEIADELGIRFDTAKWHVSEVLSKLGVERREDAAKAWRRWNRVHRRWGRAVSARFGTAAKAGVGAAAVLVLGVALLLVLGTLDRESSSWSPPRVLVAEAVGIGDEVLVVFDGETGETLLSVRPPADSLWFLPRLSPDGRYVAVLAAEPFDAVIHTFDLATGREYHSGTLDQVSWGELHWSPDGSRLVSAGGRLLLFTPEMELLAQTDAVAESGGRVVRWAYDSSAASLAMYDGAALVFRDGRTLMLTDDALTVPPPDGPAFDPRADVVINGDWDEDARFRLHIMRNGRNPSDDEGATERFEVYAVARATSTGFVWAAPRRLTHEELERYWIGMPREIDDLRQRASALIDDANVERTESYGSWRLTGRDIWAQMVSLGESGDAAAVVVFKDEHLVIPLRGVPILGRSLPRNVDVIIAQ